MSEIDVARTVQKLMSVAKFKKLTKLDKKRHPLTKNKKSDLEEFQKRSHLYQEIFSESNDVLNKALVETSDWLLPFLQDALFYSSRSEALSFVTQLEKAVECKFSPSEAAVKELIKILPVLIESVVESISSKACAEAGVIGIRLWALIVKILSKEIIAGHETVNSVCSVFAQGFKSSKSAIVQQSFASWRAIIEAFAADSNWTGMNKSSNEKRLELVLRALRHKVTPDASLEIFDTWWFLAESLKDILPAVFDKVLHGLMRFCVGGETEYILPGADETEILERLAKPVSSHCKLVSIMSECLNTIKYSRTALNVNPELVPKLHLVLDAILGDMGPFSTAFSQKIVVKLHSIFLTQCIRWISCSVPVGSSIVLSLPALWLSLSSKINRVLRGEDRRRESKFYLAQLHAWVCENKHGNELAIKTVSLLQTAGAFADFQGEYQRLRELFPETSAEKPTSMELSQSPVILPISSTQLSEMSVNNEAIRSLSYFQSSNADCVVQDSTLPVSQYGSVEKSDVVELSSSTNCSDSSIAVSETIAMSARSVDDIIAPYSSPKTSTPDSRRLRNRAMVVGSRDRSQQQTPASVSSHSIAQYFTRKPSIERSKRPAITADNEKEGPIRAVRTTRCKTSSAKDEAVNSKLQTAESGDKFSSPNIIEETPLEEIAKYGTNKSITPTISLQPPDNTLMASVIVTNREVEGCLTLFQNKILEETSAPPTDVISTEEPVKQTETNVNSITEGVRDQASEDVLISVSRTASPISTTPKSDRLSSKLGTPGILKKIDSPANPDKKVGRHLPPNTYEVIWTSWQALSSL